MAEPDVIKTDVAVVEENGKLGRNTPFISVGITCNIPFTDDVEDFEEEPEPAEVEADSLATMLNNGADDDYYGYDDAY